MDELVSKQAVKDQFKDWKQYKGICEVIDAVPTDSEELISKRYLYEMADRLESQAMEIFTQAKSVGQLTHHLKVMGLRLPCSSLANSYILSV